MNHGSEKSHDNGNVTADQGKRLLPVRSQEPLSRRGAFKLLVGCASIGAAWGTGFTAISSVGSASLTVCGDDGWQVSLIVSGRSRAIVLMGNPAGDLGESIARLMGSFRQRIDLVIGGPAALDLLPASFRRRWNVQRTFVLGGDYAKSLSAGTTSVASPIEISVHGRLMISLTPMFSEQWYSAEPTMRSLERWIVNVQVNASVIRLAERLEDVEMANAGPSTIAVAPTGNLPSFWSIDPGSAIAVNSEAVPDNVATSQDDDRLSDHWLVPVFPEDLGRFEFREHGIEMPEWARKVTFIDSPE